MPPSKRVYKLVLTGGPCGGKTTAQAKLATFFESVGWKVFRVPETATVLMSGGIAFGELNQEQVEDFQVRNFFLTLAYFIGEKEIKTVLFNFKESFLLSFFRRLLCKAQTNLATMHFSMAGSYRKIWSAP